MISQTAKPFANRDCVSSTPCYRLQGHKSTNWMEVLRHEKYINSMPAVQFKPDKLDSGCCDLQRGTTSLKARTYSRSQLIQAPEHPPGHNFSFFFEISISHSIRAPAEIQTFYFSSSWLQLLQGQRQPRAYPKNIVSDQHTHISSRKNNKNHTPKNL
jgi:hypothetical protein